MNKTYLGIAVRKTFDPTFTNLNGLNISTRRDKILFGKPMSKNSKELIEQITTIKEFIKKFGIEEKDIIGYYSYLN
jgi:hypothetical protein